LNGYVTALHPPCRHDYGAAVQAATNMLAAHARVAALARNLGNGLRLGMVLNMAPVRPADPTAPADQRAADRADGVLNRWFSDPLLLGRFPPDVEAAYADRGLLPTLTDGDRALLAEPSVDFLGLTYYYPHYASAPAPDTSFHLNTSGRPDEDCIFSIAGCFRFVRNPRGRYTDWGWEVDPSGLLDLVRRVHAARPDLPLYVTENGVGRREEPVDGVVDDGERIDFVRDHLKVVHQALAEGVDVRGYYMWSLMDNFSWVNGYKKRYGFLYVDRQTMARIPKRSAAWYREAARRNGFDDY